ncbi:MAG: Gfo/Idh/MocA family oxidoreductase [Candidatus Sumerlaeota bacterium]
MTKRIINFGVIGCGLMGREFASAAARWLHLLDLDFEPRIVAVCDVNPKLVEWFTSNVPSAKFNTANYRELLAEKDVEAVYCAVPHNLHEQMYIDIIRARKHLLGEKPFGIDKKANDAILREVDKHPDLLVRCSSQFPFYPGAHTLAKWIRENQFGRIIEVEAGFWHSSDLNPNKPINWKRTIEANGEYGCMGDLGMHVAHIPIRSGWMPRCLRAQLVKIVDERPDGKGGTAKCETWDNAILSCDVETGDQKFPMTLSTKRIAPGHGNTWFLRVLGTKKSAEFSTKNPKVIRWMDYSPGGTQAWQELDLEYHSAYAAITGHIFEFGFCDSMLQMWAAFCDELCYGKAMRQPFHCATPQEAAQGHAVFTAALESHMTGTVVKIV